LLRHSANAIDVLCALYDDEQLSALLPVTEVLLEASTHCGDSVFGFFLQRYAGPLPLATLTSLVIRQDDKMAEALLSRFESDFQDPDRYYDVDRTFAEFRRVGDKDALGGYTFYPAVRHPVFADHVRSKFAEFDALQLAVQLNSKKLVNLLADCTLFRASKLLANGDNIVHLMVSRKGGESLILQRLLDMLERECGSRDAVRTQFLLQKSQADGLDCFEYCAGVKVYYPVLYKFEHSDEQQMFALSKVVDVEITHALTQAEEDAQDKKAVGDALRQANRARFCDLIADTEALAATSLFATDFCSGLGLDLTDPGFTETVPKLRDKRLQFIDTLDALKAAADDLQHARVLGVDLEFSGDKRVTIASLLQVSTVDCDYVVDTLLLRHAVGPVLTPVFRDAGIVKVFHGCDYDIALLLGDLDIEVLNVFDVARAFGVMGRVATGVEPAMVSFEYLLTTLLGATTNKFFQVAEWRLRPLPKVMLNYCRADSHYLLYIYAVIVRLMVDGSDAVALPLADWDWLQHRATDKWSTVCDEFAEKMSKFMVQRIEKTPARNYTVKVHL